MDIPLNADTALYCAILTVSCYGIMEKKDDEKYTLPLKPPTMHNDAPLSVRPATNSASASIQRLTVDHCGQYRCFIVLHCVVCGHASTVGFPIDSS